MKIATFNVNSIRSRLAIVLDWLAQNQADVLCLQKRNVRIRDFRKWTSGRRIRGRLPRGKILERRRDSFTTPSQKSGRFETAARQTAPAC
jgi:hypothetical protein